MTPTSSIPGGRMTPPLVLAVAPSRIALAPSRMTGVSVTPRKYDWEYACKGLRRLGIYSHGSHWPLGMNDWGVTVNGSH